MTDNPTTIPSPDLNQQVSLLSQMADQIRSTLRKSGISLPSGTLEALAQIAGSLERLRRQIDQHEEERTNLLALTDVGQVVNSSLELDAVLRIVMDTIVRLTGAERAFLMLREGACGDLTIRIARNWEQESIHLSELTISRTIVNRVINEGIAVLTTNAQEDPRFDGEQSVIAYSLRSILCVPLKVKGLVTGVIYADNRIRTGIFSEAERKLLLAFADQAAGALENARLYASVRQTLAEVTELKNLMDNVFASIASGVITSDIEDRITLCNRAAEAILARPAADLVGQPVDIILPGESDILCKQVAAVRQSDQPLVGLEYRATLPRRGPVTFNFHLSPLKDASETTQGVAIVVDDLTEQKRLEGQRRLFSRMVSPAVIAQLNPDELHLGGTRQSITTLFADVRGFTHFSEQLDPEKLVSVLNCYLAAAAEAILAQAGTIDKFLGDAVMAWFNAPIPQPDHTRRAICAALGIREAMERLRCTLPPELQLSFGVGIHYGDAVLGLVGTESRLEYTAIGDSVNTAKRIQENSAGGQILISAEVYNLVAGEIVASRVEPIIAKGKSQPVEVYELLGLR